MDQWNDWFDEAASTPVGQIVVFLVFLAIRLAWNEWSWRRKARKTHRRKETSGG